ncbi:protein-disulfide reductase DsbD [Ideonella dechloratans]|uniref:Thiol:disulfide interchange protein DsbD n=1 Tax=Ideonella dechloratans TaxID=36863 RepID=A0A643FIR5_IDEDE|nr:protein-disulfide reductase DsbD [Ideonella dechloratans]KAB0584590.1 protein-disulfide reductase DsbD [Ideonella dechloratans]UFU10304.1 protein-disulfide reductase DsbD [Ideonella dechloratans]
MTRFSSFLRRTLALLAAATLGLSLLPARADDFLDPAQAFPLQVQVTDGGRALKLHWAVTPGYHLYRERLAVRAADAAVTLGPLALPPGHRQYDPNLQKEVEIYAQPIDATLPVQAGAGRWRVEVDSQGCADAGLCYPPQTQALLLQADAGGLRQVSLVVDDAPAATGAASAVAQAQAMSPAGAAEAGNGVERALRSGSLLSIAGVFLLAGLLLSFTPCVLPMVPILSSIIVGQAGAGQPPSRARGLALSLAYSLGMALVYTALGVAAGLLGEGLAAYLQKPAVLAAFAVLLVGLALSMFGFYELQLPQAWQSRMVGASTRLPGGRFGGVFLMGGLSALIVGPCVAAPLAGALVYIGQTRDVLLGGAALFSLAAGMSVPLLLVGLSAGSLLPRAGAWMEQVKRFFGVLLLAVALWMVSPVLPAWGVMAGWALLLICVAVGLRAFDGLAPQARWPQHLGKGLGMVLALVGAAQLVGALSGGRDALQPLAHLVALRQAVAAPGAVATNGAEAPRFQTVADLAALEQAVARSDRPVLLDVSADWCTACGEMERLTFRDPAVQARMGRMTLLRADVTANSAADRALLKRFGLFGPPGIVFFDPRGGERTGARVVGYVEAAAFARHLDSLLPGV